MYSTIQLRRDTAANWTAENPVLADGEAGFARDTNTFKLGDGVTPWSDLPGVGGGPGGEAGFGGGMIANAMEPAIFQTGTGPYTTMMRTTDWLFSNPWADNGVSPAFDLEIADDDIYAFGTTVAGWYSVRYQARLQFAPEACPSAVRLQGSGYYGENIEASVACTPYGGDWGGFQAGTLLDITQSPVWIPALGDDDDNSGYFYAQIRWTDIVQRDLLIVYPISLYVALLKAT